MGAKKEDRKEEGCNPDEGREEKGAGKKQKVRQEGNFDAARIGGSQE